MERFSNKMAIAPTASISIICGGSSPGIEPNVANSFTHKTLSGSFNVRNKYLKQLLEEKGQDTDEIWSSVTTHEGSVQHLDFLTDDEKDVFKTAFEMDQRWIIDLAGDRAEFICQSQSLNVFIPADVHKKTLHDIHWMAWKKGVKTLYYCRSKSIQRAEAVSHKQEVTSLDSVGAQPLPSPDGIDLPLAASAAPAPLDGSGDGSGNDNDYEECLACQ